MHFPKTTASSAALALLTLATAASSALGAAHGNTMGLDLDLARRQQQAQGTPLYLDSPHCDFFQCSINVTWGDTMTANWLNAPPGNVILDLMTNNSADLAYNIATVPAISQPGYCDAGAGVGTVVEGATCGGFSFIIPSAWKAGNYSMRATSSSQPDLMSYTDVILIFDNLPRTKKDAAFATVAISGAPTATTNFGGNNYPSLPAATAPTAPGAAAPSASATSSPASTGSGSASGASSASGSGSGSGSSSTRPASAASSNSSAAPAATSSRANAAAPGARSSSAGAAWTAALGTVGAALLAAVLL